MTKRIKGFTLVEMLVTIILISIVAGVIIYNTSSISKKSLEKEYQAFIEYVKSAAMSYSSQNSDVFQDLYVNKSFKYITTGELIVHGYLDEYTVNPYTKEIIGKDEKIKAVLDTATGALSFEYPLESNYTEEFLVALDDYVIWGEPYDCMQGIGTYKLALSKENGDLITDTNSLTNDYRFECSYPAGWYEFNDTSITGGRTGLKNSTDPGTYEFTYSWYSKSGTRKTQKRRVIVLDKFAASFDVRKVEVNYSNGNINGTKPTVSNSAFDSSPVYDQVSDTSNGVNTYNLYVPEEVDCSSNIYNVLAFKPVLTGADLTNSEFTITKTNANGNYLNQDGVIYKHAFNGDFDNLAPDANFDHVFIADDGDVEYSIQTRTTGHYFSGYQLDTGAKIRLKQELIIPSCKLSASSSTWATNKGVNVTDSYSPVGIVNYEYKISDNIPNSNDIPNNSNIIAKGSPTDFEVTVISPNEESDCEFVDKTFDKIFVRPINGEGYYGAWTPLTINITNNLYTLIGSNLGTSCENSCEGISGSDSLSSLSCYYCNKNKYVKYNNRLFNVLGRTSSEVLITDDEPYVEIGDTTEIKHDTWTIDTPAGPYSEEYDVEVTKPNSLVDGASTLESSLFTCNYQNVFNQSSWNGPDLYYGYSGIPTINDFGLFRSALSSNSDYWLNNISVGYYTTVRSPYGDTEQFENRFYNLASSQMGTYAYANGTHGLKTMHLVNNGYVCSGDGSDIKPYVIF